MNLVSDSHLKLTFVLEDINNLLNTGEIPFLYESDEKAQVLDAILRVGEKDKIKIGSKNDTVDDPNLTFVD